MIVFRSLLLLLGSTVVLGRALENGVPPSAAGSLTSVPQPTGQLDTSQVGQHQHDKQISIASAAAATAAKWHWLELIRRQKASKNETETTTRTRTRTVSTPLTSKTTETDTSTKSTHSSKSKPAPPTKTPPTIPPLPSSPDTSLNSTSSTHFHKPSPPPSKPTKPTSTTVVKTTTLPNGDKSTFTSVHVMTPPSNAAAQATNSNGGAPSLQSGVADSMHGRMPGNEAIAFLGGAFGLAYLL